MKLRNNPYEYVDAINKFNYNRCRIAPGTTFMRLYIDAIKIEFI